MYRNNPRYWGRAGAGIIFFCGNKVLLVLRSDQVTEPLTWGIPGGSILSESFHQSETTDQADLPEEVVWRGALKETKEELGSLPDQPSNLQIFDKVVFKDGGFTYTTFFVKITKSQKKNWNISLNWENDEFNWFEVDRLPADLHPGIRFLKKSKSQYFVSGVEMDLVPDDSWTKTFILPKGTLLWHGAHQDYSKKIEETGHLRGDMWTAKDQTHKVSRGSLVEEGLVWFFTNFNLAQDSEKKAIDYAQGYAKGREAKGEREVLPGKVFEIETQKDLKIIYRYKKLNAQEAERLQHINKRTYDRIEAGTELESAVRKLFMYEAAPMTYRQALPALDYDGISFDNAQIGLVSKDIKIINITQIS